MDNGVFLYAPIVVALCSLQFMFSSTVVSDSLELMHAQFAQMLSFVDFPELEDRRRPVPPPVARRVVRESEIVADAADAAYRAALRCGQKIPPESLVRTADASGRAVVTTHVRSSYRGKLNNDGERKDAGYSYNYDVDIHNTGDVPVQLMTRHWVFTGADGRYEEVRMPGAGGKLPELWPGERFEYQSGVELTTVVGSLHGSFHIFPLRDDEDDDKVGYGGALRPPRPFDALVGRLALAPDGKETDVPCPPSHAERIPPTSVSITDRVVIGASLRYAPELSDADLADYAFRYEVQINNARDAPVGVLGRRWEMIDGRGGPHEEEGEGIGGEAELGKVKLEPGRGVRFTGILRVPTPKANVAGHYWVKLDLSADVGEEGVMAIVGPLGASTDGKPVEPIKPLGFLLESE